MECLVCGVLFNSWPSISILCFNVQFLFQVDKFLTEEVGPALLSYAGELNGESVMRV